MGFRPNLEFSAAYIAHTFYRFAQLVLALTVVGLYGVDLHKANKLGKYSDGKWVSFPFLQPLCAQEPQGLQPRS